MTDVVAIIRLHNGEDVIAIIAGELDNKLRVEHPYFIKYNAQYGSINMIPYCAMTDEIFFQIQREKIEFVAVANNDISDRFLKMVDQLDKARYADQIQSDEPIERFQAATLQKTFIEGNDTKH